MPDNKVLLIEDCAPERNHTVALLTRAGFSVTPVETAEAALDLIQELGDESPPVLVVDWELPKINGMQLVMLLRGMEFRLRPYVMMLTSRAQTGSVVAALNRGADDYVTKPIIESELVSRLRVADRTVTIQRNLVERAEVLEAQLQRALARDRPTEVPASSEGGALAGGKSVPVPPHEAVLESALQILEKLHLPVGRLFAIEESPSEGLVVWTGLAIPKLSCWLDICLVVPDEVAAAMVSRVVREDVISDSGDWLVELIALIRSQLRKNLGGQDLASVTSVVSRTYRGWPHPLLDDDGRVRTQQFQLELDCGPIVLAVGTSGADPRRIAVGDLVPGLFLAEAIRATRQPGLTLAKGGTVVTRQLIETFRRADLRGDVLALEVSPFAKHAAVAP